MGAPIIAMALFSLVLLVFAVTAGLGLLVVLVMFCESRRVRYPYVGALLGSVFLPLVVWVGIGLGPVAGIIAIPWGAAVGGWLALGVRALSGWIASRATAEPTPAGPADQ